jgi:predicted metal-dependent peptidase
MRVARHKRAYTLQLRGGGTAVLKAFSMLEVLLRAEKEKHDVVTVVWTDGYGEHWIPVQSHARS